MRHFKRGRKLNRTASHRSALLSNLASSFIIHKDGNINVTNNLQLQYSITKFKYTLFIFNIW